ncbi:MAG: HEAT repeat domain-containing protein [Treponema sp.]|jgi:HEAT repeat protein|nr:HEAT repeat domain-containing protein [Treponema sp.]
MKRYLFLALMAVSVTVLYGLSDSLQTELEFYTQSGSITEKLAIIRGVADEKIPDAGEFYGIVLERLLREYPSVRGNQQLEAAETAVRLLTGLIGDEKYEPAASSVWRAVSDFSNPLVRESGLIALGKLEAKEFLPQIIRLLTDLNSYPRSDIKAKEDAERVAYGAIIALEHFKDPAGYLPVFFASSGWYHDRVKSRARSALPEILEDPSEPLIFVIKSSAYVYGDKFEALQTAERSWAATDKKAEIAVAALAESWRSTTNDPRLRRNLVEMRKLAMGMIGQYKTEDESVYPLLERTYKEGSEDEKFPAINTLAFLGTEKSAQLLSSFLRDIMDRLDSGLLTRTDERMARMIIPALGDTGQSSAVPVLRIVRESNWSSTVKRLAADALKKIG